MKQLIVTLGLVGFLLMGSCSDKKEKAADTTAAIAVKVQKVNSENQQQTLSVSGKVEAVKHARLSTRTMGYVQKVYVEVGSKVRKGQLLLSINNADLTAQSAQASAGVAEAEAAFNNAKKDYERFQSLFKSKSASQKELDDITAHYSMAKARLKGAKEMKASVNAQFSYSNIRAPFSGIITQKMANAGDLANPGMPLIEMENPTNYEVLAMLPESEITGVKKNTKVEVFVKSINKMLQGKVTAVSSSAQSTGGQYLVKVALEKKPKELLSGMFATVVFPVKAKKAVAQTITVPVAALVKQGELTGIYTVSQSNTAILRWLRLGQKFGDNVEVLSGLSANENYILSAEGKLYNGAKITVK